MRTPKIVLLTLSLCLGLCSPAHAAAPDLAGTYWSLMSLFEKGKPVKESQNPPDVEFLKDGTWGILHYGGTREAGKYTVQGDTISMKMEDGSEYTTGTLIWSPDGQSLDIDSGKDVMRLKKRTIK